jgi:hypothetical protein
MEPALTNFFLNTALEAIILEASRTLTVGVVLARAFGNQDDLLYEINEATKLGLMRRSVDDHVADVIHRSADRVRTLLTQFDEPSEELRQRVERTFRDRVVALGY